MVHRTETYSATATTLSVISRFTFFAVLAPYYWASAFTKLGDGPFGFLHPSDGAYYQIFPTAYEAAGYNSANLSIFHDLVVLAGTWAEFILPFLIIIGLFTRLTAFGMIGFILVQSYVDLYGHGMINDPAGLGLWFDKDPSSTIADQRLLWLTLLCVPLLQGGGAVSVDYLLRKSRWFHKFAQRIPFIF